MESVKLAKQIVTIDRLTQDYKRTGCGTCKRVAGELQQSLVLSAYKILKDYEKTRTK